MHGHHRKAIFLRRLPAHRVDIVADEGRDAGGVHEDRFGGVVLQDVIDGVEQLLLAAKDDVRVGNIGGEAHLGEIPPGMAGFGGPGFPGCRQAGDRPMHQMGGIGIGEEGNLGPFESTATRGCPGGGGIAGGLFGFVVGTGALFEQLPDLRFGGHSLILSETASSD